MCTHPDITFVSNSMCSTHPDIIFVSSSNPDMCTHHGYCAFNAFLMTWQGLLTIVCTSYPIWVRTLPVLCVSLLVIDLLSNQYSFPRAFRPEMVTFLPSCRILTAINTWTWGNLEWAKHPLPRGDLHWCITVKSSHIFKYIGYSVSRLERPPMTLFLSKFSSSSPCWQCTGLKPLLRGDVDHVAVVT